MATTGYPPNEAPGSRAAVGIRRFANDKIAEAAASFLPNDGTWFEFLCECGDLSCRALVQMTLGEYQASSPGSVSAHKDTERTATKDDQSRVSPPPSRM